MSVFSRVVEATADGKKLVGGDWEKFAVDFPGVYELLQGLLDDDLKWKFGPATLMFWVDTGVLHCCAKPKFSNKLMFTTIPDPLMMLESLQDQLSKGHFEWKNGRTK